jgi:hypothetical protein
MSCCELVLKTYARQDERQLYRHVKVNKQEYSLSGQRACYFTAAQRHALDALQVDNGSVKIMLST